MRCGDCKFWKPATTYDEDREAVVVLDGLGFCMAVDGEAVQAGPDDTVANYHVDRIGERSAIPCDGSGYRAALLTRDRFGCVLFEIGKYK